MEILFKNQDWLVINKPTGISTHGAHEGDLAAQEWLALYHSEETFVCSRLDKGTSGVLLFARNPGASKRAQTIHETEASTKTYVFLSHLDSENTGSGLTWQVDAEIDGKDAKTVFRKLGAHGAFYKYEAVITRGRTHQIRRHAALSKLSILGDSEYGGANFPRLCLHCASLQWPEIPEAPLNATLPVSFTDLDFQSDPEFLAAFDRRHRFFEGVTNAFRCIQRGELAAHDCAVDKYGDYLCIWSYDEHLSLKATEALLLPYINKLQDIYGCLGWVLKKSVKNPHSRGLVAEQLTSQNPPPPTFSVEENGLSYSVSLTESQHVGLFLDQRDNRARVLKGAKGLRVANLFSYTCSFSVAAAAGACEVVFSVDVAGPCLEIGKKNFELNALTASGRGKFVKEDVRKWLLRQERKVLQNSEGALFDIIICDPPTFSSTRDVGVFSVSKEWEELVRVCSAISAKGTSHYFSTNHRASERNFYKKLLQNYFTTVIDLNPPLDFPVTNPSLEHVKLFLCKK